jgi:hypothetical protein
MLDVTALNISEKISLKQNFEIFGIHCTSDIVEATSVNSFKAVIDH